ncbi:hypothetical protein R5R35_008791 [Gryllus longicercus]|uniref:Kazal-like domain-containing protein n=1 Tax=Gryllus longicercus TaxID=2509291 RepID=A0AAN9W6I1_9ORTH
MASIAVQAGVLLVIAVLLHSSRPAHAEVVESHHIDVILPHQRPCPKFCPEIYQPVCVAGCRTPLTTFPNRCVAGIHACEKCEVLWVIHKGPCRCKRRNPFYPKSEDIFE